MGNQYQHLGLYSDLVSEAYTGQFLPGPHKFDLEMQTAASEWLKGQFES